MSVILRSFTEIDDILQRIAYCGELRLLNREVSKAYVGHRCMVSLDPQNPAC
jgi:hypothetical protein